MAKKSKVVESAEASNVQTIIGTFEGECADSNITNLNGLDITREVWENVFNSDDYKRAIDLGWYIGYLGHPEDPNCMDFQNACIVMTEGHIDSDGKIYGKFNLIDTPVGRIVKSFIDAGVTFGISVRGAGDIYDNSVDPDTFVFRGFDLVSFPAYPESVPTFTEIAASTDLDKRKKYKKVCAAVKDNIDGLNTMESIAIVQSQFAKQSDEYQVLQQKLDNISSSRIADDIKDFDLDKDRIRALTQLYSEAVKANKLLRSNNSKLKKQLDQTYLRSNRKLASVQRIMNSQVADLDSGIGYLKSENKKLHRINCRLELNLKESEDRNLKYKREVESASQSVVLRDSTISRLRSELGETVTAASNAESRTSNLDAKVERLQKELTQTRKLLADYQVAYASLYGGAVGNYLNDSDITATTTVSDIQQMITSSVNIPQIDDDIPIIDDVLPEDDGYGLVTL